MEGNQKNESNNEEIKTVEGNEGTGNVDTQTINQNEGTDVDVKAEAQKIADAMFAKKMKGMPSKEELKAFKEWQEAQKTAEQKQSEKETEYQKTLAKNTELENENKVFRAGVKKEDVDYVAFKVSKMEGEFEENLTKFLKDNPKYLGNIEPKIVKKVGSSLSLSGKQATNQNVTNQIMNDLIRGARE